MLSGRYFSMKEHIRAVKQQRKWQKGTQKYERTPLLKIHFGKLFEGDTEIMCRFIPELFDKIEDQYLKMELVMSKNYEKSIYRRCQHYSRMFERRAFQSYWWSRKLAKERRGTLVARFCDPVYYADLTSRKLMNISRKWKVVAATLLSKKCKCLMCSQKK